ncbi:MAG TPA: tetratricopeptide repeat protein [Candidatus Acidoferrales bacterium]|nr:tetratricopeptide repeat protein [Candidatus Acidoferrales bacterium]
MTQHSALSTQHSLVGVAVATLAAAAYANALANGLVWDDPIVLERQLLAFRSLGDLFFPPANIPQFSPDYYRPLTVLSYLVDRTVGGTSPFVFHLSVVLWHIATTYLVFRLGLALFAGLPEALSASGFGAALFAVHPIHTESVAWGAGRSDVIAACFAVAAALVYLQSTWSPLRRAAVAAALVFIAMLAKETAAALLLILPLGDLLLERTLTPAARPTGRAERRRQRQVAAPAPSSLLCYAPFVVVVLVYLALRRAALSSVLGGAKPLGADVIVDAVAAVGVYISKLLVPIRQCAYISDLPTSPLGLLGSAALIAGVLAATAYAWRRNQRRVFFLLVWIGMTLAPSLAIVVKIPAAPIAERYLYLPSVGFCLLVGYLAAQVTERARARKLRVVVLIGCGLVLTIATIATVARNAVWRSNLDLWQDTAAKNATDALPMRSLATAYQQLGDAAKATEHFQVALQRRNDQSGLYLIYNNLGSIAMVDKRLDEAEQDYRAALAANPNASECLFNLGLIALTRATDASAAPDAARQHEQALHARQLFEQALTLSPLDPDIHVGLGQTLSTLGDGAGARTHYERALQLGLPAPTAASVRKLLDELK